MRLRLLLIGALSAVVFAVGASAAPETSERTARVRIASVTSPVSAGAYATLTARVSPSNARCSITVHYKSGPSKAKGLGVKRPKAGKVSWRWKVGSNTTPGRWRIVVDCDKAGKATRFFRVTR